jgi:hypothetical protein
MPHKVTVETCKIKKGALAQFANFDLDHSLSKLNEAMVSLIHIYFLDFSE